MLQLLALFILSLCAKTLAARSLKEELAGNFIDCHNSGYGVLDSNLLQTATQTSEPLFGYFITKDAAHPLDATITVRLLRDLRADVEQASHGLQVVRSGRRFSTMYPSVVWCNNRWHTITRLIDEGGTGWSMSNYLITQMFNEKFEPVSSSRLVGLPTFLNGVICAGLEDPRLILFNGRLLIQGNVHIPDPNKREDICRVGVFDAGTSAGFLLDVPGHQLYRWEKSWTGFVKNGKLHYLYSLAPLVELECQNNGDCEVAYHEERCPVPPCQGVPPRGTEVQAHFLRGGTSLMPWNNTDSGYYVGFAHTNMGGDVWKEAMQGLEYHPLPNSIPFHKTHLFVYNSQTHRVVYISSPIVLGAAAIQKISPRYNGFVQDPSSFVLTPDGHFVVGINLDDSHSVIAAVHGLVPVIEDVIRMDQSPNAAGAAPAAAGEEGSPNLLRCTMHAVQKYLRSVSTWR